MSGLVAKHFYLLSHLIGPRYFLTLCKVGWRSNALQTICDSVTLGDWQPDNVAFPSVPNVTNWEACASMWVCPPHTHTVRETGKCKVKVQAGHAPSDGPRKVVSWPRSCPWSFFSCFQHSSDPWCQRQVQLCLLNMYLLVWSGSLFYPIMISPNLTDDICNVPDSKYGPILGTESYNLTCEF